MTNAIAEITKCRKADQDKGFKYFLTIKDVPGGPAVGQMFFTGKKEARNYCKLANIQTWNF
jgi:hypothetical protein